MRTEADRLRSKLPAAYDGPAATLFVGQVDINSSLIADAALTRVDRFIPELEQTLEGRRLLLKPHPMAPKSGDLLSLYEHFPNARFIAGNIYALLASPAIERVVTLSSSVAAEAPMFDKPVRQLITPDIHTIPGAMASRFHRVDARATSVAFWGDLLDGMPSFMFLDAPPPPLRQRFSVSWGYGREMIAPVSRQIVENEVVSFARGGRGRDLCLFGWSDPEPWGVWSDGGVALLQFDPPADLGSGVAEIVLAPFVPDSDHPLSLTVAARGSHDITATFHSAAATTISVPIAGTTGAVELLFRFSDRVSPRQFGTADDDRLLGVGLHRMTIRRTAAG